MRFTIVCRCFSSVLNYQMNHKIWAAALFHDVGKAIDGPRHAQIGAELLVGVFNENIRWLIRKLQTHPS